MSNFIQNNKKNWGEVVTSWSLLLFCLGIFYTLLAPKSEKAQYLPIEATLQIGSQTINLEVADEISEQLKGLKHRPKLEADQGIYFSFEKHQELTFWMKDVIVPLDIVFLDNNQVVKIVSSAEPCQEEICLLYKSWGNGAIELKANMANSLGIKVGDKIKIKYQQLGKTQIDN